MWSLGLKSYNKSFLCTAVRAPASSHDVRMLKSTLLYQSVLNAEIFLRKAMTLEGRNNIPFVTIGDVVFPRHTWI